MDKKQYYPEKWDFDGWIQWYLDKNPSETRDEAVGFTLFQSEMDMRILLNSLATRPSDVRNVEARGQLPTHHPRYLSAERVKEATDDILRSTLEDLATLNRCIVFQTENACHEETNAYQRGRSEYDLRTRQRSRRYQDGKTVAFPWGLCGYPAQEIEAKHANR